MKPRFTTSKTNKGTFVRAREYSDLILGLTDWVGTSACLVKRTEADKRMLSADYGSKLKKRTQTDASFDALIKVAFSTPLVQYKKKGVMQHNDPTLMQWINVGIYEGGGETVYFDLDYNPPDKLYGSKYHTTFVDSKDKVAVKYAICPYLPTI